MDFLWLKDLVNPVMKGLDALFTSDDERGKNETVKLDVQRGLYALETAVQGKLIELELARMEMAAKIAAVEAASDAWYVKARRPFLEVSAFLVLTLDATGLLQRWGAPPIPETYQYGGWLLLGVNNALRGGMQIGKAVAHGLGKK